MTQLEQICNIQRVGSPRPEFRSIRLRTATLTEWFLDDIAPSLATKLTKAKQSILCLP